MPSFPSRAWGLWAASKALCTQSDAMGQRLQAVRWAGAPKQPEHTAGIWRASESRGPQALLYRGSTIQLDLPPSFPSLRLLLSSWLLTSGVIIKRPFGLHFHGFCTVCGQHRCLSKTQSWDKAPGHGMQVLAGPAMFQPLGFTHCSLDSASFFLPLCLCPRRSLCLMPRSLSCLPGELLLIS